MSDTLTDGIFSQNIGFGRANPYGLRVIEVEPIPIYGPARRHRKRRVQKKWLKRFGTKIVGYDHYLGDKIFTDLKRGVAYCHPYVCQQIRQNTTPIKTQTNYR